MSLALGERTSLLEGIEDQHIAAERWRRLLRSGGTNVVFLTPEWQRAWWSSFGRGRLLPVFASRGDEDVALAPFFTESGMIYFVGSGGSDYLDFIGDVTNPSVLAALLSTAIDHVPDFLGVQLFHVPETSPTVGSLMEAASQLGLVCIEEGTLPAPVLEIEAHPDIAEAATRKKSLRRHEASLHREGSLTVSHLTDGQVIQSHLPAFFEQHIARWEGTAHPSRFNNVADRRFIERLVTSGAGVDWLRFTRLDLNGCPVALHLGFCYQGVYLWYIPTYNTANARHSPGEVLLRQVLLAAIAEEARILDFGLGDEPYKARFATRTAGVRNWGLYPPSVIAPRPSVSRA